MNLISKLIDKLQNVSPTTKRRIISLILAGGMAFSGLTMAGCDNTSTTTPPPIVDSGTQNPAYAKYSQILQNVLNDNYYTNLISVDSTWTGSAQDAPSYQNPKYNAIPYGFLEEEGFNIDEIKNKQVSSKSDMYTIGNDLYIELRVETKASKNYFTNYILKYTLTDKELHEFNVLFTNSGSGKTTFYRAPFFVQELSYAKTPEVVSKSYVSVDSLNAFEDFADNKQYIAKSTTATYLNAEIIDNYSFHTYQIHQRLTNYQTKGTMKIGQIKFLVPAKGVELINNKNVTTLYNMAYSFDLLPEDKTKFEENIQTVNCYNCEYASFKDIFENDSTKNLLDK